SAKRFWDPIIQNFVRRASNHQLAQMKIAARCSPSVAPFTRCHSERSKNLRLYQSGFALLQMTECAITSPCETRSLRQTALGCWRFLLKPPQLPLSLSSPLELFCC